MDFKVGDIVKASKDGIRLYLQKKTYFVVLSVNKVGIEVETIEDGKLYLDPRRFEKVSEKDFTKLELMIYFNKYLTGRMQ